MSKIKTDFYLVDKQIERIKSRPGVELLAASQAWQEYAWTRTWFKSRPELGYFLWFKKSQSQPLASCVSLANQEVNQQLDNLIVVEPAVAAEIKALCQAETAGLSSTHQGRSQVVLKDRAELSVFHQHAWQGKELVLPKINFFLKKQARLKYVYQNLTAPASLKMNNRLELAEKAKADSIIIVKAAGVKAEIKEAMYLKGKKAAGSLRLRLVGEGKSRIEAVSKIVAEAAGRGHLDCQGLLVDQTAEIKLVPKLVNQDNQALVTHEASIGRIEREKLEYLQSRGLTENQAINLVIRGFLNVQSFQRSAS